MGSQFKRIMSLKKVLMLSFAALVAGGSLSAQNLIVGADFATRFDNREYANNDFNESQTLFSARFTPRIGVEWMEKNRLIFGVDLLQNFGQHNGAREPFLSDVKPLIYYQFNSMKRMEMRSTTTACRVSSGIISPPSARIPM